MIRRHPVGVFVAIAYLLTWVPQALSLSMARRHGIDLSNDENFRHFRDLVGGQAGDGVLETLLLFNAGQFGPAVAALGVTMALYGRSGVRDLLRRTVKVAVPARWYLVVLALPLVVSAASLLVAALTSGFDVGPFDFLVPAALFVPFLLYMLVFNGLAEEPGWRGFALPHLQANGSAARASWQLGLIWGIWHVPFTIYFNRENPLLIAPSLLGLTFGIVGWTMVNTWIYNSTGSVWLFVLLHAWNNTVQSYLVLSQPNFLAQTAFGILPWAIAVFLSKRYGDEDLAAVPRLKWWPKRFRVPERAGA